METRAAALDIGTNSVLLLVAAAQAGAPPRALVQRCVITRLGADVDRTGSLDVTAIDRTLAALRDLHRLVEQAQVSPARRGALGTSALRDAANRQAFLGPARAILGVPVEVASGDREAELVLRGVGGGRPLAPGTVVFDVGGGSTELIAVGADGALAARVSLDIGSVRLTERHLRRDPPPAGDFAPMRRQIEGALARLPPAFGAPERRAVIGVAGTVTTLATIELALASYDSERVNRTRLSRQQVERLWRRLIAMPLARRQQLAGLEPERADVITSGAFLVGQLMDHLQVDELQVSDRGVRWGLAQELLAD